MWFRPKRYGYGSGLPISWEGWWLVAGFVAAVIALNLLIRQTLGGPPNVWAHLAGMIVLVVPFCLIVRSRTEGGWRWRNGGDD
jgi:hypothetical protein